MALEYLFGNVRPLPLTPDFSIPLPNSVTSSDIAHGLIGITGQMGGYSDFGYQAFDGLDLPLLTAEAVVLRAATRTERRPINLNRLGIDFKQVSRYEAKLRNDPNEFAQDFNDVTDRAKLMASYFVSLAGVFSGEIQSRYEDITTGLTISPDKVGPDALTTVTADMLRLSTRSFEPIDADSLAESVGLGRREAVDTSARIKDSLFQYLLRSNLAAIAVWTSASKWATRENRFLIDEHQLRFSTFSEMGKQAIRTDIPFEQRLRSAWSLYPEVVETARRLVENVPVESYISDGYPKTLRTLLESLDSLALARMGFREPGVELAFYDAHSQPSEQVRLTEPVGAEAAVEEVVVEVQTPVEAEPAINLDEVRDALLLIEDYWLEISSSELKQIGNATELAKMLVKGVDQEGLSIGGVEKPFANSIIGLFRRFNHMLEHMSFEEVFAQVMHSQEAVERWQQNLTSKNHAPGSTLVASLNYISANAPALIKLLNESRYAEGDQTKRFIRTLATT